MDNEILVSICCLAYNHEKYIRKTLDGFISQKVDFKFEVLIHDDASTDNTASIIKEYEEKYPEIIKPIYQKENQYQKRVKISQTYQYPRAKGKYIAFCEGDDYWCDQNKLSMQVKIMEENENISGCFHKVSKVSESGELIDSFFPKFDIKEGVIHEEKMVEYLCNIHQPTFQTSSYLIRSKDLFKRLEENPTFIAVATVGDIPTLMYHCLQGDFYYIDRLMSCYRVNVPTSWTARTARDTQKNISAVNMIVLVYKEFNKYTDFKYTKYINEFLKIQEFRLLSVSKDYKGMLNKKYRKYFKALSLKAQIIMTILALFPFIKRFKRRK